MKSRRDFLKSSAILLAASAAGAVGAPGFSFGQTSNGKTLVKVFMRGGADGLELFPKVNDPSYYKSRPNIAIAPPGTDRHSAIGLGTSTRAMNPFLEPLMEIWDAGRMMISPATALDEGNRSHFDCQRWIGNGAKDDLIDGYLNRYLQRASTNTHSLRGAVLGNSSISPELTGSIQIPSIVEADRFKLQEANFCVGEGCEENRLTEMLQKIASQEEGLSSIELEVREDQLVLLESIEKVKASGPAYAASASGLEYSATALGRGLKLVAQLLKAGVPLEVASVEWKVGWDTHSNQGSPQLNQGLKAGATDFLTFFRDIGQGINDVVILVGTEFGRTVKENGSKGTDHGHSGAWFAFGGPTVPGVAQDVPNLDPSVIGDQPGIPTVVNYRDIVAEIMVRHLGMEVELVSSIFPGHVFSDNGLFQRMS